MSRNGRPYKIAKLATDVTAEVESNIDMGGRVATTFSMSGRAVDEAKQTTTVISSLNGHASRIGDAIALIQGIARKTNLLALNAKIERLNAMSSMVSVAIQHQEQVVRDMSADMREMSTSAGAINGSMSLIVAATDVLDQSTQRVRSAAQALR